MKKIPQCEVCQGTNWTLVYSGLDDRLHGIAGKFTYYRCDTCNVGRIWPIPVNLDKYYPSDYYAHKSQAKSSGSFRKLKKLALRWSWKMRFLPIPLGIIGTNLSRGRRFVDEVSLYAPAAEFQLLDVGCGRGDFLQFLRLLGIEGAGLEVSPQGAQLVKQQNFVCHAGPIEAAPFELNSFDIVRFNHVLEHLRSPRSALIAASGILRKDGKLVIRVPAADSIVAKIFKNDWFQLDAPRHIWQFSQFSLRKLVETCGFDILTLRTIGSGKMLKLSWQRFFESSALDSFSKLGMVSDKADNGYALMAEAYAEYGQGEEILLIAKKNE